MCVIFRTIILIIIVVSCDNVSAAVSTGLFQVSLVYLSMEMIQPGKLFLKFVCWSKEAFKKYEDVNQIITSLFFTPVSPRSHHKKFFENRHGINSRLEIQWHQLFLIFLKIIFFKNNLNWPFQLLVPILIYIYIYIYICVCVCFQYVAFVREHVWHNTPETYIYITRM